MRRGRLGSANVRLPPEGRQGEPPEFPLPRRTKREFELWADLWGKPQAVAWESIGCELVVGRYVRVLVAAEKRGAPGYLLAEARRLEDKLGLNSEAMARLRWTIDGPADAEAEEESKGVLDIRERLKAVE